MPLFTASFRLVNQLNSWSTEVKFFFQLIVDMLQVFHEQSCLGMFIHGRWVEWLQMHRLSTQQKAADGDITPNTQTVIADGALLVALHYFGKIK